MRGVHIVILAHLYNPCIRTRNQLNFQLRSGYASDICRQPSYTKNIEIAHYFFFPRTARTFPVNGKFTPPQRELYAALLATQKALVRECTVARGHSLDTLHRRSVDLLRAELERVGLPCAGTVLERVLYPHYLTHPIGIGEPLLFLREFSESILMCGLWKIDLHEAGTVERSTP